jgi:hypothetical protein
MMLDVSNINKETNRQILHEDLRNMDICAKFVPHRLTDEQKQRRLTSRQGFIQTCQDNPSLILHFFFSKVKTGEPGYRSRYSDQLRAGRPRGRRVKNFLSSKSSRSALRSTQPPIQWVPGALSRG